MESQYNLEELVAIVAKLTEKYTSKESTSISYQKARQLMEAVIYCLHEHDLNKQTTRPSDSIVDLSSVHLEEMYREGYQMVVNKVNHIRRRFNETVSMFNAYGNRNYNETFLKGIPAFLTYYDARFNPQNHILTLDYPVLQSMESLSGADAIDVYVECICLEQIFLGKLLEDYVRKTLTRYHNDYEELFINICSAVLRDIIISIIVGQLPGGNGYSQKDYNLIKSYVDTYSKEELQVNFEEMIQALVKKEYENNQALKQYLLNDMMDFSFELKHAVSNNYLENMI